MKATALLLTSFLASSAAPLLAEPITIEALSQRVTALEKQVAELQQQVVQKEPPKTTASTNENTNANTNTGEIVINFPKGDKVLVEGKEFTLDALRAKLKQRVSQASDVAVIIRHDASAPNPNVVSVLSLCSEVGIWNVASAAPAPKEAHAEAASDDASKQTVSLPFVIALNKEGKASINDKELTDEALEAELAALASKDPDRAVVIKCHPATRNEHLAHKLRLCQKAKLWKVSIATPPGTASHAE